MRPKVPLVEGELECSTTLAFEGSEAPPFQHASTAEQALATFRLRLITDINPPTMDGLELTRRVRPQPRMPALPIVVTTL